MKLIKFKGQKDYDKINHLPFNREYNLRPSLVESMKNKGFIDAISLCYSTAFGTKELYLLDGQHRALAANYLNIEFYGNVNEKIIETKEELVELVATYNNTSVCWELITYVKAYIALNYEDYVELYKVSKENGFSVKTIASLFINYLVDGGGNPTSAHSLISGLTVAANDVLTTADTFGINTAALINIGANASVGTSFVGVAALGLPAVLTMASGSTIDKVSGAVFALSLDASASGGTADIVSLCRSIAIPNGVTTVNRLYGYQAELPFGDPGTLSWGLYSNNFQNNWMYGALKIGGTAGSTDTTSNSDVRLEVEGGAFRLPNMDTTARNAMTALAGMVIFNTSTSAMEYYNGTSWV